MKLFMMNEVASAYRSNSQRARVVTEAWGEENLYCANCSSASLARLPHNTKAVDYECPACQTEYQLKCQQSPIRDRINDGSYAAMMDAIRSDSTPNFFFLQYDLASWSVSRESRFLPPAERSFC
jgi:type II restriction enzyme